MSAIELREPRSIDEAVALLAQHADQAKLIAGGTAVVIMLQNRLISPAYLISLGRIDDLRYIRYERGTGLHIGALTTIGDAQRSPIIRKHVPVLASTFGKVANVRVRNAATVGGNLTEADYASDPPAVLVALRARVVARGPNGTREIPLNEFFQDFYETSLAEDEVVTELIVPEQPARQLSSYIKYVTRSSEDRPCIGAAAVVNMDEDGVCQDLRVVLGAVAATPQEVTTAEALAHGQRLTDDRVAEIAEGYAAAIKPLSDMRGSAWYRTQMIKVLVRRAIKEALQGPAAS